MPVCRGKLFLLLLQITCILITIRNDFIFKISRQKKFRLKHRINGMQFDQPLNFV